MSQMDDLFYWARSTAFCSEGGNCLWRTFASFELISSFRLLMEALLCNRWSMMSNSYCWFCSRILATREEVPCKEDCSSLSAFFEGILMPKPPSPAGRANRAHSWLLGVGQPVRAGSNFAFRAMSRGFSR